MNYNYTKEAWEEEQMSNLGCESVEDLIRLAKENKALQREPDSPRYKQKPYEIQIWFHAQFHEPEGRYYLAEPHVVIKKSRLKTAYEQYDSIIIHDPFYIQLVEYNECGDGDILEEGGTWEMVE